MNYLLKKFLELLGRLLILRCMLFTDIDFLSDGVGTSDGETEGAFVGDGVDVGAAFLQVQEVELVFRDVRVTLEQSLLHGFHQPFQLLLADLLLQQASLFVDCNSHSGREAADGADVELIVAALHADDAQAQNAANNGDVGTGSAVLGKEGLGDGVKVVVGQQLLSLHRIQQTLSTRDD